MCVVESAMTSALSMYLIINRGLDSPTVPMLDSPAEKVPSSIPGVFAVWPYAVLEQDASTPPLTHVSESIRLDFVLSLK